MCTRGVKLIWVTERFSQFYALPCYFSEYFPSVNLFFKTLCRDRNTSEFPAFLPVFRRSQEAQQIAC